MEINGIFYNDIQMAHLINPHNEVYSNIPGCNTHMVSNKGNVRNNKTLQILKNVLEPYGFQTYGVKIKKDDTFKKIKIHDLLAYIFIPNPRNYNIIEFLDGNILNYNIENLKWIRSRKVIRGKGNPRMTFFLDNIII